MDPSFLSSVVWSTWALPRPLQHLTGPFESISDQHLHHPSPWPSPSAAAAKLSSANFSQVLSLASFSFPLPVFSFLFMTWGHHLTKLSHSNLVLLVTREFNHQVKCHLIVGIKNGLNILVVGIWALPLQRHGFVLVGGTRIPHAALPFKKKFTTCGEPRRWDRRGCCKMSGLNLSIRRRHRTLLPACQPPNPEHCQVPLTQLK